MSLFKDKRITKDILIESLAKEHKISRKKVVLKVWNTAHGSSAREGFACDILAVEGEAILDGKDHRFNYMAKVLPRNPFSLRYLKDVSR